MNKKKEDRNLKNADFKLKILKMVELISLRSSLKKHLYKLEQYYSLNKVESMY